MDESNGTCGKRLDSIGVENTEDNRRSYRELLVTTPGLGDYISGAILFEETLYQSCSTGKTMVEELNKQGIVAGIKVRLSCHSCCTRAARGVDAAVYAALLAGVPVSAPRGRRGHRIQSPARRPCSVCTINSCIYVSRTRLPARHALAAITLPVSV
jgi:Fructose-bisphosphate aldolase class-I